MSRVLVIQPALPRYRLDFFQRLSDRLGETFSVYYSPTDLGVLTEAERTFPWAKRLAPMRPLFRGAEWQPGVLGIPLRRGDIIVVSGSPRNLSNMLLLLKARLVGAKTIWWGQYWSSTSRTHRFILRLLLMRLAHAILFYTDMEVADYRSRYGKHDRRPISALNNGIDVEPINKLRAPYRAALRDQSILFIGRLTEKADFHLLLEALTDAKLQNVRLHVIGDGPQRTKFESVASDLAIHDRVIWHGGMTREADIADVANQCRVFVYPGGIGLSLIHAMAYGLPVIVHEDRWRHMPEIAAFQDEKTGRSFTLGDAKSLSGAIASLMQEDDQLDKMSLECTRITDEQYNTSVMSDRFCEMTEKLKNV